MDIRKAKLILDTTLYREFRVSQRTGRRRLKDLSEQKLISPERTPTGRCLLSVEDAEKLVDAL